MSLKNLNVVRAIRRRQIPMTVTATTTTIDTATGGYVDTPATPVTSKGCFQQMNRFDNYYGDEMEMLTEGERKEASTLLWTEYSITRGYDGRKADIITESSTGRQYKVLAVRTKFYGNFHRAVLGELR